MAEGYLQVWLKWNSSTKWERNEPSTTLCHLHLMKLVSSWGESWWRSRKSENGQRERMTLRDFKMKDSTCFRAPLLKERRKVKRSMPRGLRRSVLRKLRPKRGSLLRFKERESRFSAKCTKRAKMWRWRIRKEIWLKNMRTLDHLYMLQSLETDYLLIRRQISMKFNLKLSRLTRAFKNWAGHWTQRFMTRKLVLTRLSLTSRKLLPVKRTPIW